MENEAHEVQGSTACSTARWWRCEVQARARENAKTGRGSAVSLLRQEAPPLRSALACVQAKSSYLDSADVGGLARSQRNLFLIAGVAPIALPRRAPTLRPLALIGDLWLLAAIVKRLEAEASGYGW